MQSAQTKSAEYLDWLDDLAEFTPRAGWVDASDLPAGCLSEETRALVFAAHDQELLDEVSLDPTELLNALRRSSTPGDRQMRLGRLYAAALDAQLARALICDLQEIADQREDDAFEDRQRERDDRTNPMLSDATALPIEGELR